MAYFPNGTSGMMFQEDYCNHCENADEDGMCSIWDAHMLYNYEQFNNEKIKSILTLLIPDDGACSMYRKAT